MKAPTELPILYRAGSFTRADGQEDIYTAVLSTERPVKRWWGQEILSMDREAVDFSRMEEGGIPFLADHINRTDNIIGRIEGARVGTDRKLHATLRFADTRKANDIRKLVDQRMLNTLSIGYRVDRLELTATDETEGDTFTATKWSLYEASAVAVPADPGATFDRTTVRVFPVHTTRNEDMSKDNQPDPDVQAAIHALARKFDVDGDEADGRSFNATRLAVDYLRKAGEEASVSGFRVELNAAMATFEAELDEEGHRGSGSNLTSAMIRDLRYRGRWRGDQPSWSLRRLIGQSALAQGVDIGQGVNARAFDGPEKEFAIGGGKFHLPFEHMDRFAGETQTRIVTTGTSSGATGGNIVPERYLDGEFIEALRNRSALLDRVRMLRELDGEVVLPRKTATSVMSWGEENPSQDDPTSDPAFDQIKMEAREGFIHSDYTRKQLVSASPDMEMLMRQDFLDSIAQGLDLAVIAGTGSGGQPTGLLNIAGIGSVVAGTNGAAPTWANIVDLEAALGNANADMGDMLYVCNSKFRAYGKKTLKVSEDAGAGFIWDSMTPDRPLNGYPVAVSNQVPSNLSKGNANGTLSALMFLNASEVILGMWRDGIDIYVDPMISRLRRNIAISVFVDADVALRHTASVAAMKDALV